MFPSTLSTSSVLRSCLRELFPHVSRRARIGAMGESRLVEELLTMCLQRIRMEESSRDTEQGEPRWPRPAHQPESSCSSFCIHLPEMIKVLKNFETVRKQWLHSEVELKKYKELLVKSDVAKAALEVKLKHARNQLDLEMKKRFKLEGDYQYLVSQRCCACGLRPLTSTLLCSQQRQMQLMCDILVHDSKSSAGLNDEQKSLLAAFEQRGANVTTQRSGKR